MDDGRDNVISAAREVGALARLEALAASGMTRGDGSALAAAVADLSRELQGSARDAKRTELLANALACARVQSAVLEAMYAKMIAAKDEPGIALLGRALRDTVARLVKLAEAHAAATERERRPPVVVGRATVDFLKVG